MTTKAEREVIMWVIAGLRAEVARYKEQAAKGTEYVLAQINEDLRAELTEMTKQRDHHASTIFINSVQIGNLRAAVARKTSDRALAEKEVDELRAEVARLSEALRLPVLLDAINADLDGDGLRIELSPRGRYVLMSIDAALPETKPK